MLLEVQDMGQSLEIVVVSSDRDEAAFASYHALPCFLTVTRRSPPTVRSGASQHVVLLSQRAS